MFFQLHMYSPHFISGREKTKPATSSWGRYGPHGSQCQLITPLWQALPRRQVWPELSHSYYSLALCHSPRIWGSSSLTVFVGLSSREKNQNTANGRTATPTATVVLGAATDTHPIFPPPSIPDSSSSSYLTWWLELNLHSSWIRALGNYSWKDLLVLSIHN